jgi:hypothetical protein
MYWVILCCCRAAGCHRLQPITALCGRHTVEKLRICPASRERAAARRHPRRAPNGRSGARRRARYYPVARRRRVPLRMDWPSAMLPMPMPKLPVALLLHCASAAGLFSHASAERMKAVPMLNRPDGFPLVPSWQSAMGRSSGYPVLHIFGYPRGFQKSSVSERRSTPQVSDLFASNPRHASLSARRRPPGRRGRRSGRSRLRCQTLDTWPEIATTWRRADVGLPPAAEDSTYSRSGSVPFDSFPVHGVLPAVQQNDGTPGQGLQSAGRPCRGL